MAKKDPKPGSAEYDQGIRAGQELWQQAVVKIRSAIKRRGLTQQDIAKGTGISQPALSRFLSGDDNPITVDRLLVLMEYLDFSWVMQEKGRPADEKPIKAKRKPRRKK